MENRRPFLALDKERKNCWGESRSRRIMESGIIEIYTRVRIKSSVLWNDEKETRMVGKPDNPSGDGRASLPLPWPGTAWRKWLCNTMQHRFVYNAFAVSIEITIFRIARLRNKKVSYGSFHFAKHPVFHSTSELCRPDFPANISLQDNKLKLMNGWIQFQRNWNYLDGKRSYLLIVLAWQFQRTRKFHGAYRASA